MRFSSMSELAVNFLIEDSLQIAWNYLQRTGELEEPENASRFLIDAIESMFRQGVRSRLLLSNRAITAYQRYRQGRQAA
jgi:hypothetical protein